MHPENKLKAEQVSQIYLNDVSFAAFETPADPPVKTLFPHPADKHLTAEETEAFWRLLEL